MKSKKTFITLAIIILICIIIALCLYHINNLNVEEVSDGQKFKQEYEALNEKPNNSNNNYYLYMDIDENYDIKYLTENETIETIENGTGIIYFGFPTCPWCRATLPVLLEVAAEMKVKVNYLNIIDLRSKLIIDEEDNVITEKQGTPGYYRLLELMNDFLGEYNLTNKLGEKINAGEKRLYAPTIAFIKEGRIIAIHKGTVDSQEDPYEPLTNKQKIELKNIYVENVSNIK